MKILSAEYCCPRNSAVRVVLPETGAALFSEVDTPEVWAEIMMSGVEVAPYVPPPEPPRKRLFKKTLWARMTEAEGEAVDAVLKQSPARLRRMYDAATYLDIDDPDFPALRDGILYALNGDAKRAAVLLVPDH